MHAVPSAMIATAAIAVSLAGAAAAQEVKIKPEAVPRAAVAVAAKDYPHARVTLWEKQTEAGSISYEATMKEGRAVWQLVFDAHGGFVAREEEIPVTALPAAVRDAVRNKYPRAVIRAAEKITRAGGVEFELGVAKAAKKVLFVSADGVLLREE